jgi:hypothetical protein
MIHFHSHRDSPDVALTHPLRLGRRGRVNEMAAVRLPEPAVGLVRWALQEMRWNLGKGAAVAAPREMT